MKAKLYYVKILTDLVMLVLFLFLMGRHLFGSAAHEWLGIAAFCAFLLHNAFNFRWYKGLFRGRYSAVRVLTAVINALLWACMILNAVSSVLISDYIFADLNVSGVHAGRKIHLAVTAWTFLLVCIHFGMHWSMVVGFTGKIGKAWSAKGKAAARWMCRLAMLAVSIYGIAAFVQRELYSDLFLLSEFKFADFRESPLSFFVDYHALTGLFAAMSVLERYKQSSLQY